MKTPTVEELLTAAEWLDQYEDQPGDDNGRQCRVVAMWLRLHAAAKEIRDAARNAGVSAVSLRKALKARKP
jgi:DNA-binding phage protein